MKAISIKELAFYAANELTMGHNNDYISKRIAAVLILSNRSAQLGKFTQALETELVRRGVTQVVITSAIVLKEATKHRLATALGVKHPVFHEVIDTSVIGGARVETADKLLDLTVRRKLTLFKETAGSAS
jgi:F0F1-type ATP synthase delta subunit